MDDLKKSMLEALNAAHGNVSKACEQAGVERRLYYRWRRRDPEFAAEADSIRDEMTDAAEEKLMERIKAGDTQAITFYLKTRGKSRGYSTTMIRAGETSADGTVASVGCLQMDEEERKKTEKRMVKIMIADDQQLIRESLKIILDSDPDFEVVKAENPILIEHLFTMSAGFNYDTESENIKQKIRDTDGKFPTRMIAKALSEQPLDFEPGAHWQYRKTLLGLCCGNNFRTARHDKFILSPDRSGLFPHCKAVYV